jgi:hypothetical protein
LQVYEVNTTMLKYIDDKKYKKTLIFSHSNIKKFY